MGSVFCLQVTGMFLLFVIEESLVQQKSFMAGLLRLFESFVTWGGRVCGTDGTASEIKLIFKGWRSQCLKNESWTSVQLRSSEQREANTAFLGAEQPPALLHSTFVVYPRSVWVYFQHKERWIGSTARLHPFCPPALPEGIWEGAMLVKCNSSARSDRQEKACCL